MKKVELIKKQLYEARVRRQIKRKLRELIKIHQLSDFPTANQIRNLPDGKAMINKIYRYGTNLNDLRKELSCLIKYRCGKYSLQHWDNLKEEIKKNGFSPAAKHAACRFHSGGIETVRERLEIEQLKEKEKQAKEKRLKKEVLKIAQERKSASIKEIYDEIKKKGFYQGLDALKIESVLNELTKKGLLNYIDGIYAVNDN
jgi:hypothetical protein